MRKYEIKGKWSGGMKLKCGNKGKERRAVGGDI